MIDINALSWLLLQAETWAFDSRVEEGQAAYYYGGEDGWLFRLTHPDRVQHTVEINEKMVIWPNTALAQLWDQYATAKPIKEVYFTGMLFELSSGPVRAVQTVGRQDKLLWVPQDQTDVIFDNHLQARPYKFELLEIGKVRASIKKSGQVIGYFSVVPSPIQEEEK